MMDSNGNPGMGTDGISGVDEESVDVTTIVEIPVLLWRINEVVVVGDCVVRVAVETTVAVCVEVLGVYVDV
jgi:hypothetical protein